MFTYLDLMHARTRYEEMLKEAEERRRVNRYAIKTPSVFERAFTSLRSAFAPKRTQHEATQPQTPAMRKGLATE